MSKRYSVRQVTINHYQLLDNTQPIVKGLPSKKVADFIAKQLNDNVDMKLLLEQLKAQREEMIANGESVYNDEDI
jgi:hypothetical protein